MRSERQLALLLSLERRGQATAATQEQVQRLRTFLAALAHLEEVQREAHTNQGRGSQKTPRAGRARGEHERLAEAREVIRKLGRRRSSSLSRHENRLLKQARATVARAEQQHRDVLRDAMGRGGSPRAKPASVTGVVSGGLPGLGHGGGGSRA